VLLVSHDPALIDAVADRHVSLGAPQPNAADARPLPLDAIPCNLE
jgi:ATPase subunit of ABC transporter with duplicated ATPase domains